MIEDMKKHNMRVPNWSMSILVWLCAIFAHIPAGLKAVVPRLGTVEYYVFSALFILTLFMWFATNRITTIKKGTPFLICYIIVVVISTLKSGGSVFKLFYETMRMTIFYFVVSIAIRNSKQVFWDSLYKVSLMLLLANAVVWILFPNGFSYARIPKSYFFDTTNETPNYVIPLIALMLIGLNIKKRKKIETVVAWIILIANALMLVLINSSTSKVGIVLFVVLVIFSRKLSMLTTPRTLFYSYVGLLAIFVFFDLARLFAFIIVDILGENLTLHTRTLAWEYAKEAFALHPIIGKGYLNANVKYSVLAEFTRGRFSHSHCEFFEFLLRSGIVGTFCFGSYLYKRLSRAASFYKESKSMQIVIITVFVFLIMSINETCFSVYFYLFLAIVEGSILLPDVTIRVNHRGG